MASIHFPAEGRMHAMEWNDVAAGAAGVAGRAVDADGVTHRIITLL